MRGRVGRPKSREEAAAAFDSARAVLIPALGCTLMYFPASIAGGAPSSFSPRLVSRIFAGKGSFEDTAAVLGFGVGIATWRSLAHDLTDAAQGALGVIDMRQYEWLLNEPRVLRAHRGAGVRRMGLS